METDAKSKNKSVPITYCRPGIFGGPLGFQLCVECRFICEIELQIVKLAPN